MTKLLIQREVRLPRRFVRRAHTRRQTRSRWRPAKKVGRRRNVGPDQEFAAALRRVVDADHRDLHVATHLQRLRAKPAVQKYFAFKDMGKPKPKVENANELSALLELPPFIVGRQKIQESGNGLAQSSFGGNDVVLFAPSFAASRCWLARVGVHLPLCRWFAERLERADVASVAATHVRQWLGRARVLRRWPRSPRRSQSHRLSPRRGTSHRHEGGRSHRRRLAVTGGFACGHIH